MQNLLLQNVKSVTPKCKICYSKMQICYSKMQNLYSKMQNLLLLLLLLLFVSKQHLQADRRNQDL